MKRLLLALLLALSSTLQSKAWELEPQLRSREDFSQQRQWGMAGFPLIADERTFYVPMRKTEGWREVGDVRKIVFENGLWMEDSQWAPSRLTEGRRFLVPDLSNGVFLAGTLREVKEEDPDLQAFMGLDANEWLSFIKSRDLGIWGAPVGALVEVGATEAFPLRKSVIYVQCGDGMLAALDGVTGKEMWAFSPPSLLGNARFKTALACPSDSPLPWLMTGSLCAEDLVIAGRRRTVLCGTLGKGGRGLYCLDVTDPAVPEYLWCREDLPEGAWMFRGGYEGTSELGFIEGASRRFSSENGPVLNVPSGIGVDGALLWLNAESGLTVKSSEALETELLSVPAVLCDASGEPDILLCTGDRLLQAFILRNESFVPSVQLLAGRGMTFYGSPAVVWFRRKYYVAVMEHSEGKIALSALELTGSQADLTFRTLWRYTIEGEALTGPQIYEEQVVALIQTGNRRELFFWDLYSGGEPEKIELREQATLPVILDRKILEVTADSSGVSVTSTSEIPLGKISSGALYRAAF